MEIRRTTLADFAADHALSTEAFGGPPAGAPRPTQPTSMPPGRDIWAAYDGKRLVAKAEGLALASWWHGARVPTCGVASVAVAAEHRGRGLLRGLFAELLDAAHERGEPISTLFPTANGIYRGLGYELVSSYDLVEVPTAELARVRPPIATHTRRATEADLPAARAVHGTWAAAQNGPLTRGGTPMRDGFADLLTDVTATSLAVDAAGKVVGYASWDRGEGYDQRQSSLRVWDLLATTIDGYRALWTMLGTFASVAGTIRLQTSGADAARLVLPGASWQVVGRHPYLLRISDVVGAFEAIDLSLPGLAETTVDFAVEGDPLCRADGSYRLTLGAGPAACEPTEPGGNVATFTPQGLALKYAGVQSCANLRMAGQLAGPDDHDQLLDAVLGGRPVHVRDYF